MAEDDGSRSFYFFDLDDNLFFLPTKLYLWNEKTQEERAVTTGEFAKIQHLVAESAPWEDWSVREHKTWRDCRDLPGVQPSDQCFPKDLMQAIAGTGWQGPSWPLLEYASEKQRPVALITARGHAPETVEAAFNLLVENGLLPSRLSILGVYTISNPDVRKELNASDESISIPQLKKLAIKAAVEKALQMYGVTPPHRFGMSDDDPNNVMLAINAMRDCKEKYPDKRFFVINTNRDHYVKLEIFPMMHPVTANRQNKSLI